MNLHTEILAENIIYTGAELRPHWVFERTKRFGSGLVAFRGACEVPTAELVDLEDKVENSFIRSREMLHFIGEFFGESLELSVVRQRLFVAVFTDTLRRSIPDALASKIVRDGDDIYFLGDGSRKKLSVSIVTATAVSTLLHFGVNIDATGAPVEAIGLNAFPVDVARLTEEVLHVWKTELASQEIARCKVIPR